MRKLSISRAWDESRQVLSRDGGLLATVALALLVLPGVIAGLVSPETVQGEVPEFGWHSLVTVAAFLLGLVGQLALIRLAIGSRQTVGEAIGHGVRRALPYIAAMVIWLAPFALVLAFIVGRNLQAPELISGAESIAILVVVVLMLFLAIRMLMASPVATSETAGPIAILRRSWELTSGNWWRLFAFFLLFLVAVIIIMAAVGAIIGVIIALLFGAVEPMSVSALLVALVTQVAGAAITVVFVVMLARIYVQLAGDPSADVSVPSSGT